MYKHLIDYYPRALAEVREFQGISEGSEPVIDRAIEAYKKILEDQFLFSADEDAVELWEKELGITPSDSDTLDRRKQRIRSAWVSGTVYTRRWLRRWIDTTCGADNPDAEIKDYTVSIKLPITIDYAKAIADLNRYLPVNMLIKPTITLTKHEMRQYYGGAFRVLLTEKITFEEE